MAGKQSENKSGFAAYVKTFLKWVLYAGVIGIAVGILGSLFAMLINTSSGFFLEHVGYWTLFPYATVFSVIAFLTMLNVKHGDSKPEPPKGKLEAFDVED